MFSINSRVLNQILAQIRQAFGIRRGNYQPVEIQTERNLTMVRSTGEGASIACQLPFGSKPERIIVPMCTLASIRSSARHDVNFYPGDGTVRIEDWASDDWQSTNCEFVNCPPHPPEATWLVSNDRRLGQVLQQASLMTDPDSTRFALGCLRLRGSDGQIAATDGRQAFTQDGFCFPVDEVLIPASPLTKLRCLGKCTSISVGRSAEWLSLRMAVGPARWLIDLRIAQTGCYPVVDHCIPQETAARTTVTVSDHDAEYLLKHLGRLIGNSEDSPPVTLDLSPRSVSGRQIVLRFRAVDDVRAQIARRDCERGPMPGIAELVLANSTYDQGTASIAMDHRHLLNALRLGFRIIHLQSGNFPAFCSDHRRNYVWALADPNSILKPTSSVIELSTAASLVAA